MGDNNVGNKVGKILSGLNPAQLKKGIDIFNKMNKSGQVEDLKKQLENVDKDNVMEMFNKLDPEVAKQKLKNVDLENIDINQYTKLSGDLGLMNKNK